MEALSAVTAGLKATAPSIAPATKALGIRAYNKLRVNLTDCFSSYIVSSADRCRDIKNILYKDEPVDLLSQYVQVSFSNLDREVNDSEVVKLLASSRRVLISGKAGFGKTMFMKWATVNLIRTRENHQLYPIFLSYVT